MNKISVKWHSQAYFQINPSFLTDINQSYRRPSPWAKFLSNFISTFTSLFFSCIHHFWPTSTNFTKPPINRISLNGPMSRLLSSFLIEINSFINHPPDEQYFSQISSLSSAVSGIFLGEIKHLYKPYWWAVFLSNVISTFTSPFSVLSIILIEISQFHRWAEFHVTLLSLFSIVPGIHHS